MKLGKFIVFEGIDGSGKSTQIKLLRKKLFEKGITYKLTSEPKGTKVGEELLNIAELYSMNPIVEALLMITARLHHIHEVIAPAMSNGISVICDRFADSTYAYQGIDECHFKDIQKLDECIIKTFRPHYTFFLDVPVDVAMKRLSEKDDIESRGSSYFENVRKIYKKFASEREDYITIDGTKSIDKVSQEINEHIEKIFA